MVEAARQCRRPGDSDLVPGLGRSPGGGHGNPLQYPCPENPMHRGAWQAIVHGCSKESDTIEHTHKVVVELQLRASIWSQSPPAARDIPLRSLYLNHLPPAPWNEWIFLSRLPSYMVCPQVPVTGDGNEHLLPSRSTSFHCLPPALFLFVYILFHFGNPAQSPLSSRIFPLCSWTLRASQESHHGCPPMIDEAPCKTCRVKSQLCPSKRYEPGQAT